MDITNQYGIREHEPGYYVATRNGFDILCPHVMPTPEYVHKKDDKGEDLPVRFPQENTQFRRQLCDSACAKFHISKKADKQYLHCQHHGDIAHELTPKAIRLITKPAAAKTKPETEPKTEE